MMREYKRYDEYKDSGVEWIGEIPKIASIKKIKYAFNVINGSTPDTSNENYWNGNINWITPADLDDNKKYIQESSRTITFKGLNSCSTTLIPEKNLIISSRAPIGYVSINKKELTINQGCKALVKDDDLDIRYYYYFIKAIKNILNYYGNGTTFTEISASDLKEVDLIYFPFSEQQKIASFLEQKTAKINEIINKKEKLIDQLEKYKKSVITEAVTKAKLGNKYINKDGELVDEIEMKDSGIKWIGEIPEYWGFNKLKFNNLINPNKSEINYNDIKVSFVPMEYIKDGVIEDQDFKNLNQVYSGYSYFTEQDILLAKVTPCFENNNIGIANGLKNSIGFGTTEVHVIRALDDFNRFIFYLFQSTNFKNKGKSVMYGAGGLKRVPTDFVENYLYGRPEYKIQKLISNYLDQKTTQINTLIKKTKESIEKYKEYKKSLIFEAVTGKIDLRDFELKGGEELAEHNNSSETKRERISAVN